MFVKYGRPTVERWVDGHADELGGSGRVVPEVQVQSV